MESLNSLSGTSLYWTGEKATFSLWKPVMVNKFPDISVPTLSFTPPVKDGSPLGDKIWETWIPVNGTRAFMTAGDVRQRALGGSSWFHASKIARQDWETCFAILENDYKLVKGAEPDGALLHAVRGPNNEILQKDCVMKALSIYWKKLKSMYKFKWPDTQPPKQDQFDALSSLMGELTTWWKERVDAAAEFAKDQLKSTRSGDFNFRYYTVPEDLPRPVSLGISTRQGFLLAPDSSESPTIQTLCENFNVAMSLNDKNPQCVMEYIPQSRLQTEGWIILAAHALGFYTICIKTNALQALVSAQCGGEYFRNVPTHDEVEAFNKTLKQTQPTDDTKTSGGVSMTDSKSKADVKRKKPEDIMGSSANTWATDTLKWTAVSNANKDEDEGKKGKTENVIVAEWLHLIAHAFGGKKADVFNNLVLGTRECNTHMLRVEKSASDLLSLQQITQLKGEMRLKYRIDRAASFRMMNKDGTPNETTLAEGLEIKQTEFMTHLSWFVGEIDYNVSLEHNMLPLHCEADSEAVFRMVESHNIRFQPFHRFIPFVYQIRFDTAIHGAYAKYLDRTFIPPVNRIKVQKPRKKQERLL